MAKLKLGPISDEKLVRITAELSAAIHRDLLAYAEALGRETGHAVEPAQLVAPMLMRFMATDRGFAKARRSTAVESVRGRGATPDVPPLEREPSSGTA